MSNLRLIGLATLGVCLLGTAAYADFVAYNDVCYSSTSGHPALQPNVTTFNIGESSPGPASGMLVDKATGAPTGVTASLTQSGSGVRWQPDPTTGGSDCNVGTDARTVFDPATTVSLMGTVYYASTAGWYVDLTLTGLKPAMVYEFVTTANRNGSSYTDRFTRYTLSGADAFTNASTAGTVITNGGASTALNTGNNTVNGYVARWTGIAPGADGTISIRAQAHGTQNSAYTFDAFMLVETPEPGTLVLLALGGAALLRRR